MAKSTHTLESKEDLVELALEFQIAYEFAMERKAKSKMASKIQFPKIPNSFTESLAVHMLRERHITLPNLDSSIATVDMATDGTDVTATLENGRNLHIEVKGSGDQGYISLTAKDRKADYIIWFSFANKKGNLLHHSTAMVMEPTEELTSATLVMSNWEKWGKNCKSLNVFDVDNSKILTGVGIPYADPFSQGY